MSDNIKDKIARLLRLAGNNPNPHEAEAALLKARELMMAYHIAESEIGDEKNVVVLKRRIDRRRGEYPLWMNTMVAMLADTFRCEVFLVVPDATWSEVWAIGLESDLDALELVVPWILRAAVNCALPYCTRYHANVEDYYAGFQQGIYRALTAQAQEHRKDWALVLAKHPAVRDEAEKMNVRYGQSQRRVKKATYHQGEADGYAVAQRRSVGS